MLVFGLLSSFAGLQLLYMNFLAHDLLHLGDEMSFDFWLLHHQWLITLLLQGFLFDLIRFVLLFLDMLFDLGKSLLVAVAAPLGLPLIKELLSELLVLHLSEILLVSIP